MTARNDITGDSIATKGSTDSYRDGWDRIFGKKKKATVIEVPVKTEPTQEELEKAARHELTKKWWAYLEKNQKTLPRILSFEEFRTQILPTLEAESE